MTAEPMTAILLAVARRSIPAVVLGAGDLHVVAEAISDEQVCDPRSSSSSSWPVSSATSTSSNQDRAPTRRGEGKGVRLGEGRGHRGRSDQARRRPDVAGAEGRRHVEDRRAGKAAADQGELSSITSSLATLEIQRVVDENAGDLKQYGLEPATDRGRVPGQGRQGAAADPVRRKDADRRRPLRSASRPEARLPRLVVPRFDVQQERVRAARQDRPQDRSRQGRSHRDRGRARAHVTLAKTGTDWRIVAPLVARADFAAVEGSLERLSSAQMQGIVAS